MEIINDKVVSLNLLKEGFTYKKCIFKQLQCLIRYLDNEGWDKDSVINKCVDLLRELDQDNAHYTDIIDLENNPSILNNLYSDAFKKEYLGDRSVYFSKEEMAYIDELESTRSQRMLFTVMALLKFQQTVLGKKEKKFITTPVADILRFAGTTATPSSERRSLWKDIIVKGKIQIFVTQKGEDVCYKPLYQPSSPEVYDVEVSTASLFGEQWLTLMKKDMYQCIDCGQWFKKNKLRKIMRCPECNKIYRRKYIAKKVRELKKQRKEKVDNGN